MNERRKEVLTAFNQNNILEAAKVLFEKRGVSHTTMDDIARESNYSKSTIYVYFKSKEEIYSSILCEYMELLRNSMNMVMKRCDGFEESYFGICNCIVEFQEKYPFYFDSILGTIDVTKEKMEQSKSVAKLYSVGEDINESIGDLLKRGKEAHFIREELPQLPTIFYLWGAIGGIVVTTGKKIEYYETCLGMKKSEYLKFCFTSLLESIWQ